jgi:hypothetical protein
MIEWDRSGDWEVQRTFHERHRLTILFSETGPSNQELLAVRRCFPQFRDTPPAQLKALVSEAGKLCLGELPGRDARRLAELAERAGLHPLIENASYISYLPFDRATGCVLLVEDEAEAKLVADEMIAAVFPVAEIEA